MVLFVRQFVFKKKNKEKMNIILFYFFMSDFLCKFGMDGKILSRPFQRFFFFFVIFGVLVDLLRFFQSFLEK